MSSGVESNSSVYGNISCQVDSEFRYVLFPVAYSILFILGFLANGYVLWVFTQVYSTKKMSDIKIFMVNLTLADLLFLITLPLWIAYYNNSGDWTLPAFLCNVAGCLFFINTYCSIAFLTVISYNRYRAVTRPLETAQSTANKRGLWISFGIWLVISCSASPYLFQEGTNKAFNSSILRCFEGYNKENSESVMIINFILIGFFFIAFLIIVFCNLLIIKSLLAQPMQPQKSADIKRRALWMVCMVLTVFVICFVPHHIVQGPWTLTVLERWREKHCEFRKALNDAHQVTLCLMGMNCVLDPIIYCFLTKKFRKHLTDHLTSITNSRKCSKVTGDTRMETESPLPAMPLSDWKSDQNAN
ncbi:platelet-activating factor receptor [Latimeria chalumnae]|uniref:Platelet-activating factor receptor n=1 Tax=Latimeria chalumnae TaxID=7897 RepID=H3A6V3_LATCH|nr:PREDICTED: platelet-activating factor receptor [Latimeria chalumnae]|eukprot:XP_006010210.1 PREDICTED: platelet-activating factor receptor [Latimeria chalumnae]